MKNVVSNANIIHMNFQVVFSALSWKLSKLKFKKNKLISKKNIHKTYAYHYEKKLTKNIRPTDT